MRSSHPPKRRLDPTLWLAQVTIALARLYARGVEVFGSGRKQDTVRMLRKRLTEINRVSGAVQNQIQQGDVKKGMRMVEEHLEQAGDLGESQDIREQRLQLQAIDDESETLKQIRASTEGTEAAIAGYRRYIEEHPNSTLAFTFLGCDLRKAGRLEESIDAHRQGLKISQGRASVITHLVIGDVLQEMGRLEDAIAEYRIIVDDNDPDSLSGIFCGRAYLHLGDALMRKGESAKARASWEQAVKWARTGDIRGEVEKRLRGQRP